MIRKDFLVLNDEKRLPDFEGNLKLVTRGYRILNVGVQLWRNEQFHEFYTLQHKNETKPTMSW